MNKQIKIHWSFWLISIFFLIWNVMGGMNFFMQMDAEMVASFPDTHRAIIEGRPLWATGGFAISVLCGALGCILLLLKKASACYLFAASLLGTIVTSIHTIIIARSVITFSAGEMIVMIALPLIVAAFLLWYSKLIEGKGWVS